MDDFCPISAIIHVIFIIIISSVLFLSADIFALVNLFPLKKRQKLIMIYFWMSNGFPHHKNMQQMSIMENSISIKHLTSIYGRWTRLALKWICKHIGLAFLFLDHQVYSADVSTKCLRNVRKGLASIISLYI